MSTFKIRQFEVNQRSISKRR